MAVDNASQTIPVQIMHVFILCCSTQMIHAILIHVRDLLHAAN